MIRKGKHFAGDNWATDPWLFGIFEGWFDPCPLDPDFLVDGLELDWSSYDKVFVNPPYSKPLPWVRKAISTRREGQVIVMLLRHDSSTQWWRELHEAGARFLAIIGRLQYGVRTGYSSSPSVLVVLA